MPPRGTRRMRDFICIGEGPFKPGDQPPTGYNDFFEWAGVQHRAGLRQVRRLTCDRFHFPLEVCRHASAADAMNRAQEG